MCKEVMVGWSDKYATINSNKRVWLVLNSISFAAKPNLDNVGLEFQIVPTLESAMYTMELLVR